MSTITMKSISALFALSAVLVLSLSCGDDEIVPPDARAVIDGALPPDAADPMAFPALGAQIDRAGRPAIAPLLIRSFLSPDAATQVADKNGYNADVNASGWVATYAGEVAANLAVLDGLDAPGGGCGNQFGYDNGGTDAYAFLSATLADDRLVISAAAGFTSCRYLGVEAGVANSCGGRTPVDDAIGLTYSALTGLPGVGGVVPSAPAVTADDAVHTTDTFPYLAAPQ